MFYGPKRYGTLHKMIKIVKLFLAGMIFMKYNGMPQFGKSRKCQHISLLVYIFSHRHNVLCNIMYFGQLQH